MKKWGLFIFIMLLLGYAVMLTTSYFEQKREDVLGGSGNSGIRLASSRTIKIVPQDQVYEGNLVLVNKDHAVHQEGVKSDIVNLAEHAELTVGYGLTDSNIRLSRHVAQQFQQMVKAAGADNVNHFLISSGYRGLDEQEQLYQDKGPDYALPAGYSEHNLGLSLDIGSTQMEMSKAPEGQWLQDNAWKYGFILRYPKDQTDITGIQYEPWHFRYVGLPHSAIMQDKHLVLEQYLDFLKENKGISKVVQGEEYNVAYYSTSENILKVPENGQYEISGDNIAGIIVTVKK